MTAHYPGFVHEL